MLILATEHTMQSGPAGFVGLIAVGLFFVGLIYNKAKKSSGGGGSSSNRGGGGSSSNQGGSK